MTDVVYVLLGAALGAPARYLIDRWIQSRHHTSLPWGTMAANLTGSALLGLLVGIEASRMVPHTVVAFVGTGLCGAMTTFSTYAYESLRLYQVRARTQAVLNLVVTLAGGLGAVSVGYAIGFSL